MCKGGKNRPTKFEENEGKILRVCVFFFFFFFFFFENLVVLV